MRTAAVAVVAAFFACMACAVPDWNEASIQGKTQGDRMFFAAGEEMFFSLSFAGPKSVTWRQGWTHGWTPPGMASLTQKQGAVAVSVPEKFVPASAVSENGGVSVSSTSLTVSFDESNRGRVARITTAKGEALYSPTETDDLFSLTFTREEDFLKTMQVNPSTAKSFSVTRLENGVAFVYDDCGEAAEKVVCRVTAIPGEREVRWRIATVPRNGWVLESTSFPRLVLAGKLGADARDDALVSGSAKSGIFRNPMSLSKKEHWPICLFSPGVFAAQFAFYYDARLGFYTASEDVKGNARRLLFSTWKDRDLFCGWQRLGFDCGKAEQDYDIVTAAFESPGGSLDWHDAADHYREWSERQFWCAKKIRERDDLPSWMKDAPVFTRFWNTWMEKPDAVLKWTDRFRTLYGDVTLLAAYWGWEHYEDFVTDYYPCKPSDERFAALVQGMAARNAKSFPWPSGYHFTLTCGKKPDGTFDYDAQELFNRKYLSHSVENRDGKPYRVTPFWLRGGDTGCLCGGEKWVRDWWNFDVCRPLARFGCDLIQIDQVTGGNYPSCWSRKHGHDPNEGKWKVARFREQLLSMRDMMRKEGREAVVCYEEPSELFGDVVGIQDYRDCESKAVEWCGTFNYVYHEYVPCFQSNLKRADLVQQAYCAAEGQMPFVNPDFGEIATGDLDPDPAYTRFMQRWVLLYHVEGREYLAFGRRVKPPRIVCGRIGYRHHFVPGDHRLPTVFHAAFEAKDGSRRIALANATAERQKIELVFRDGTRKVLELQPGALELVPWR